MNRHLNTRRAARFPACVSLSLIVLGTALAAPARSQVMPPPQNVVNLNASATVEVNKDWLSVTFSTTRDGADAAAVQSQLKQALDAALAEARRIARPGQVEVQTGAFSLFPRYAQPTSKQIAAGQPGGIAGWQGTTELVVEGRDTAAIGQLTSRITTLSIARVATSLSLEARQKVEGEVTAQAIQRFREKADGVSRHFGFTGYTVREVSVSGDAPMPAAAAYARPMAMKAMAEDAALPVEAGKASVTISVGGSVQMTR